MGKLIVSEFITLDGVIEAPGPGEPFEHAGWAFQFGRGPDGERLKYEELMNAEVQLLGRVTYEGFAAAWPNMPGTGDFGEKMNRMPKYVASRTLTEGQATWENTTLIGDDLAGAVRRLRESTEGDILVQGSVALVHSLAADGLVDEYRLMTFPIVLGSGKRLFGAGAPPVTLTLTGSQEIGSDGVLWLTYAPRPA